MYLIKMFFNLKHQQIKINECKKILITEYGYNKENLLIIKKLCPSFNLFVFMLVHFVNFFVYCRFYKKKIVNNLNIDNKYQNIYIGNHLSHQDWISNIDLIYQLEGIYPLTISSDHLFDGILGQILRRGPGSFISRKNPSLTELKILKRFFSLVNETKIPILFYPEGGWSVHGNIKTCHSGFFHIILKNNNYLNLISLKNQYNRVFNDDKFLRVRKDKSWINEDKINPDGMILLFKSFLTLLTKNYGKHFMILNLIKTKNFNEVIKIDDFILLFKKIITESVYKDKQNDFIFFVFNNLLNKEKVSMDLLFNKFEKKDINNFLKIFDLKINKEKSHLILTEIEMARLYFSLNQFIFYKLNDTDKEIYSQIIVQQNNKQKMIETFNLFFKEKSISNLLYFIIKENLETIDLI